jgi:type II secretory pathway component PulL
MKDDLKDFLVNVLRDHTAERIYESWFRQDRPERKRRLNFVMELSIELAKIKEQTFFATGLAELGIESVIEGDWNMVKEWADHFTFNDERDEIRLSSAAIYARFSELLQQCWETRPGTSQGSA